MTDLSILIYKISIIDVEMSTFKKKKKKKKKKTFQVDVKLSIKLKKKGNTCVQNSSLIQGLREVIVSSLTLNLLERLILDSNP